MISDHDIHENAKRIMLLAGLLFGDYRKASRILYQHNKYLDRKRRLDYGKGKGIRPHKVKD